MKELFDFVTIVDEQNDRRAIMDVLNKIYDGQLKSDLTLLNFVREVPVSFKGTLENVADDRVAMAIHQNQAVIMKHDKYTLIRSSHFPTGYGVHAYVALANPTKCTSILTRFSYAQIKADRRNAVRVQIHHPISGIFIAESGTTSGHLMDISIGGVSLKIMGEFSGQAGDRGDFHCTLPSGALKVPAKLLKIAKTDELTVAIFMIEANSNAESIITQFIFNEQVNIIKDLKDRYI